MLAGGVKAASPRLLSLGYSILSGEGGADQGGFAPDHLQIGARADSSATFRPASQPCTVLTLRW
jgi:hypothetical protein